MGEPGRQKNIWNSEGSGMKCKHGVEAVFVLGREAVESFQAVLEKWSGRRQRQMRRQRLHHKGLLHIKLKMGLTPLAEELV